MSMPPFDAVMIAYSQVCRVVKGICLYRELMSSISCHFEAGPSFAASLYKFRMSHLKYVCLEYF